jgi:hypothetical protein
VNTKATTIVNRVPVITVRSDRMVSAPLPAMRPYDIEMIGLMRGATIMAPMMTAALLASNPNVAITADIVNMK